MRRLDLRSERGQSLLMLLVTLPVLLAFAGLVIDGAHAFGEKRRTQNAADAAALAAAQNILGSLSTTCPSGPPPVNSVKEAAECYSGLNGGPSTLDACNDADPAHPTDTNCYAFPYVDRSGVSHPMRVEVRLTQHVDKFFMDAIGLGGLLAQVSARAVASATPLVSPETTSTTTYPGTTETITQGGTTETITTPGSTQVTTITNNDGVQGAQAFTMSRACSAILYQGAGGGRMGSLATNGGLTFQGNADKRVESLGLDKARCGSLLPQPPNGNPATCQATPTQGQGAEPCVKTLVDLSDRVPLNWPVPPPPLPTPLDVGTAWNPSIHYPGNCILLAPSGSGVTLTSLPPAPGFYCVSGSSATLQISTSMTNGDGYTFFALNGAKIGLASNGTSVKFYWPSADCGPRPTARLLSFTCAGFSRTIAGYDPLTVMYATSQTAFPGSCSASAICFNGQNGSVEGDIFAPWPLTFPPGLTPSPQGGGTVWVAGGAASAGNGFIESWQLVVEGNGGSYTGTGPTVGGTVTTVTTTTPGTTQTVTTPGTTSTTTTPATTQTTTTPGSTTGTVPGLDE